MIHHSPILYSAPMVDAQLAGRKRQTRRLTGLEIINAQLHLDWSVHWQQIKVIDKNSIWYDLAALFTTPQDDCHVVKCPYGKLGDGLYVRETIQIIKKTGYTAWRFADGEVRVWEDERPDYDEGASVKLDWSSTRKTPSIYMPKRFARIWLTIKDIRIERLHEIDSSDARDEGIEKSYPFWRNYLNPEIGFLDTYQFTDPRLGLDKRYAEVASYASLFEKINGPGSWKKNPWVWAITTEPAERPKLDWLATSSQNRKPQKQLA